MKKLFLTLPVLALGISGAGIASAQYYNSNYYSTTYVPSTSYQYTYGAAVGSYTIGCTTYYYNMTTGASLGSQNICTYQTTPVYTAPTYIPPVVYSNPSYSTYDYYNYSYPSTQTQSQYCTWGYSNGTWRPCTGSSMFGSGYNSAYNNSYNYNGGYQNYLNCHYDQYGQYSCY